jgi:MFS family permease
LRALADPGRRTLTALILLGVVNHSVLAGSRVAVSLDALALGASTFTVGMLMGLYALLPMLLAVTAGRLCDFLGVRAPMLAGCALITVAAAVPWVARGLPALFVSAVLLGVGFMTFQIAIQHATGVLGEPTERARNFGLLSMGYSVSGFIGPLVAGLAIDHAGFSAAFAVFALLPLVPLCVLGTTRFSLPGPHPGAKAGGSGSVLDLLLHRDLRHVFLFNALIAIAWDLHMIFVPIYGARIGLTASQIGAVLASFAAATFVIRFAIPWIALRLSERQVLTAALLVAGIVYLAFPFARSVGVLLALSFCLGLGVGTGQPMVMSLLHAHAPPGRVGEATGVRMSLVQSMAVAVPLVFGAVGSTIGVGPVFWFVGAGLTLSGALSLRTRPR